MSEIIVPSNKSFNYEFQLYRISSDNLPCKNRCSITSIGIFIEKNKTFSFEIGVLSHTNKFTVLYVTHNNGTIKCNCVITSGSNTTDSVFLDRLQQYVGAIFQKFKLELNIINLHDKLDNIRNQLKLTYDNVRLSVNEYNQIVLKLESRVYVKYFLSVNFKKATNVKTFFENFKEKITEIKAFHDGHSKLENKLQLLTDNRFVNSGYNKLTITDIVNYNKISDMLDNNFLNRVKSFDYSNNKKYLEFSKLIKDECNTSCQKKYTLTIRSSKLTYGEYIDFEIPVISLYLESQYSNINQIMYYLWVDKFKKLDEVYSFVNQCRLDSLIADM